jgi:prophage regulatory protein
MSFCTSSSHASRLQTRYVPVSPQNDNVPLALSFEMHILTTCQESTSSHVTLVKSELNQAVHQMTIRSIRSSACNTDKRSHIMNRNARNIATKDIKSHLCQPRCEVLLRLPEVLSLMGISRATWYRGVKSGKYPAAVHPSERVSAWYLSDLEALIRGLRDVC